LKIKILLLFILFQAQTTIAQQLTGTVEDATGKTIFNAQIVIYEMGTETILSYSQSNQNGEFEFKDLAFQEPRYLLKITHMSYQSYEVEIDKTTSWISVVLNERVNELKEVLIKEDPIKFSKDTLSYSVNAFTDINDRSIADVIKNMPGLTVSKNGSISYQGRPIENFYIEGLNLLEGKYTLASSNINANDVAQVQVLENHEPKAILDSISTTTRTSLNIKLKNNTVTTGLGEVGVGYEPLLYNINATPLFLRQQQHIFSYQGNNASEDLEDQITDFSIAAVVERIQAAAGKTFIIDDLSSSLGISDQYYRENHDHLITANSLFELEKGLQIKYKFSYLNQQTSQLKSLENIYLTRNNTLNFFENNSTHRKKDLLNGDVIFENNKKNLFLKNTLSYTYLRSGIFSDLNNSNLGIINSKIDQGLQELQNKFESIFKVKSFLVDFHSNLEYRSVHEDLNATPQAELPIEERFPVLQTIERDELSLLGAAGTKRAFGALTTSLRAQSAYIENTIKSLGIEGQEDRSVNDFKFYKTASTLDLASTYQKKDLTLSLNTPLRYRSFGLNNGDEKLLGKTDFLLFEPRVQLQYEFSNSVDLTYSSQYSNDFNNYSEIFNSTIYSSFRTSLRNLPRINRVRSYSNRIFFRYKNLLQNYFLNVSLTYNTSESDLTRITDINKNGTQFSSYVLRENQIKTLSANVNFDKFFPALGLTSKGSLSGSRNNFETFINDQFTDLTSTTMRVSQELITEVTDQILLNNKIIYEVFETDLFDSSLSSNRLILFNELTVDAFRSFQLKGTHEFYSFSGNSNYFDINFLNLSVEKKLKKDRTIKISLTNLLNKKHFERIFVSNNFISTSSFELRPRQVLISYLFSF
jgi:hypothetical protein